MPREIERVPYGYEPPVNQRKGTMIYYDTFEETSDDEIAFVSAIAEHRAFAKLVLYPIHEETAKRMTKQPVSPYYKREKRLIAWLEAYGSSRVTVDGWEGKRKKYTPMEAALRHLTETLPAPHFLYLTPETANLFASYASFGEWIGRIRLLLSAVPKQVHPQLVKNSHRWETADAQNG